MVNRHAHQQSAADGHSVQPDVVQLAHPAGHEPLHPLIDDGDEKTRTGGQHESTHVGTMAAGPVEKVGNQTVLDEMKGFDNIHIDIAGADETRIDNTNDDG